jgi:O-antigen ligase
VTTLLTAEKRHDFFVAAHRGAGAQPFTFTAARILLATTLFASPWAFGAVQTWAWASVAVIASVSLVLWALGSVGEGGAGLVWSPLYLPALMFLGLGFVQLFAGLSMDRIATREALLKLATDVVLFFLVGQLIVKASVTTWRRVALLVTVYGFALGLFAIVQFFSSQGRIYWSVNTEGWYFGPYVNRNHFAGLMEMLIPISIAFIASQPWRQGVRAPLIFCVSVAAASFLLSGSRGGLLSLFCGLLMGVWMLRPRGARFPRLRIGLAGLLGILPALALFFWLDGGRVSERWAAVFVPTRSRDPGLVQREVAAADSLRLLRKHPWVGTGLGSFETAFAQVRSFPSDLAWDHAHNDFAEALVESGLTGGALIVGALLIFLRLSLSNWAEKAGQELGKMQLGAAVGCCILLVHSLFDFNLRIPANAAWFAVSAAVGSVELQSARFPRELHSRAKDEF